MVLSKEGAQLSWRPLCFQFSLPWNAGLVKCLGQHFGRTTLFIHWALVAPGIEQSVTAPFWSSKVLLSFLQFLVQFFECLEGYFLKIP